jgi:hypothetical protein
MYRFTAILKIGLRADRKLVDCMKGDPTTNVISGAAFERLCDMREKVRRRKKAA